MVSVTDFSGYIHQDDIPLLESCINQKQSPQKAAVIAPLDNLLWDRRFINEIFGFQYSWEVYLPAAKRKYGYYVLPVLYGDLFVARFEPYRDKKTNAFVIKNWWWKENIKITKTMGKNVADCIRELMAFQGFDKLVMINKCQSTLFLKPFV